MNSTAVQYAGALRHAGCTLSELRRTAGCLTGCAELWDALCSPAVSAREKKAVLARLPACEAAAQAVGTIVHGADGVDDSGAVLACAVLMEDAGDRAAGGDADLPFFL